MNAFQSCWNMGVPCSRLRLWWRVGNCTYSLLQNEEQEQIYSFPDRKKPPAPRNGPWWPQGPGSLLCSSVGEQERAVLLLYPRCDFPACWWGQEWHSEGEATFLWQNIIPQSWYPTAFGETATGFHLSKPCPKLFSLSPLTLQCKNDSPSPKTSGNGRLRMCLKKPKTTNQPNKPPQNKTKSALLINLLISLLSRRQLSRTAVCFVWKCWYCFVVVEIQKVGK